MEDLWWPDDETLESIFSDTDSEWNLRENLVFISVQTGWMTVKITGRANSFTAY